MNTWTLQMGYPYIELKRNGDSLEATQHWFLKKKNDSAITQLSQDEKLSPFGYVLNYRNHVQFIKDISCSTTINFMKICN